MPSSNKPELEQVIQWAKEAGAIARAAFLHEHEVDLKGPTDLVTEVDYQCEKLLLDAIQSHFPGHAIKTEESGSINNNEGDCWYIDPLDGTINYAHRIPFYVVSVAYQTAGDLHLGVVYDPSRDECYAAERGKGAWLNGEKIRASGSRSLQTSLLSTGFPYHNMENFNRNLRIFDHLTRSTQGVRRMGCAALEMCYVASGRLDGYWEHEINAWDIAAGALIVQEAGGVVTDLLGSPGFFQPPYALMACAPGIYSALLEQLNRF